MSVASGGSVAAAGGGDAGDGGRGACVHRTLVCRRSMCGASRRARHWNGSAFPPTATPVVPNPAPNCALGARETGGPLNGKWAACCDGCRFTLCRAAVRGRRGQDTGVR